MPKLNWTLPQTVHVQTMIYTCKEIMFPVHPNVVIVLLYDDVTYPTTFVNNLRSQYTQNFHKFDSNTQYK